MQIHLPVAPCFALAISYGESLIGYMPEPGNIRYGRLALSRPVPLVVIGRYEASLSIKIISHKTLINQCFFDLSLYSNKRDMVYLYSKKLKKQYKIRVLEPILSFH